MTLRSYFGKMNSTLGSVVPLAMFAIFLVRRCLFNIKSTEKRETHHYKKDQEMSRLNHNDPLNKWTLVLTETLPDSRGQVISDFSSKPFVLVPLIPSNVM